LSQAGRQKLRQVISHWQQSPGTAAKSLMWNEFC
jgi:hypothetical protein